jgi:hypothetical protein
LASIRSTDLHYAICDFVLDIVQNAVEAGARKVELDFDENDESVNVAVTDDGKGMNAETRGRALDPFYTDGLKHSKRRVGLGLPFLKQSVEQAGGKWTLESELDKGTLVRFRFPKDNVDCPPLGDVAELFFSALCQPGDHELLIERKRPENSDGYKMRRSELSEALGGLERGSSLALLRDYVTSQEKE